MNTLKIDELASLGNLELLAKQVVEGFLTGLHKSPYHGFSAEFAEHRQYNTGESIKDVDWKLFARTERMYVKKFEEETNLRSFLVIDDSSSMRFPKDPVTGLDKFQFSVYCAASLIELLRRQRDAVGLSFFSNELEYLTASKLSRSHVNMLYNELEKKLKSGQPGKGTNAAECLHELAERIPKRSMVILFTDLFEDYSKLGELTEAVQHLRHNKNEVLVFQVTTKKEEVEFDYTNRPHVFVDLETGEKIKLNPKEYQEQYLKEYGSFNKELKSRFGQAKIEIENCHIEEGYNNVLLRSLIKRQKLR